MVSRGRYCPPARSAHRRGLRNICVRQLGNREDCHCKENGLCLHFSHHLLAPSDFALACAAAPAGMNKTANANATNLSGIPMVSLASLLMLSADEKINGVLVRGKWTDVGSSSAYRQAQRWMLDSLPGASIEGNFTTKNARIKGPLTIGHNVSIGTNSSLVGPIVIGENTTIGDNVLIGPYSVIGSFCTIGNNAKIFSSYLFNNVCIGKSSNLSGDVIADNTTVGENCYLENGTVIGHKVVIGDSSTIHSGVKIWPEMNIDRNSNIKDTLVNYAYETTYDGS